MFSAGSYTLQTQQPANEVQFHDRARGRALIMALEAAMKAEIAAGNCDDLSDELPIDHHFIPGAYGRCMAMPAGTLVVGKIHRNPCFNYILKGTVTVATEQGVKTLTAPQFFISGAGTKRGIVAHTDAEWMTVHGSTETDLDKLEAELICPNYAHLEQSQTKALENTSCHG